MHHCYNTHNINRCRNLKEHLFKVYICYYKSDIIIQKFEKWRCIKRFKPTLNIYKRKHTLTLIMIFDIVEKSLSKSIRVNVKLH